MVAYFHGDYSTGMSNQTTYDSANNLLIYKKNLAAPIYIKQYFETKEQGGTVASRIGLTANKLKKDEVVLGITGTYEGEAPTGTINITQNGVTDVTNYASANVNVEASGEKDVNFYDYDGTLVNSYTKTEFLALNAMPANPTHTGLVAEGWNWTLSDAKDYVTTYGKLIIGQNYTTLSGKCEFDIELNAATGLTFTLNVVGTKNWGDGTIDTNTSHTYTTSGTYTITCDCTTFSAYIFSQSSTYNYSLKNLRLSGIELQGSCLKSCYSLETVSVSKDVTFGSGSSQFEDCIRLKALVIPKGTIEIPNRFFYVDCNLETVCFPKEVTTLGEAIFRNCYRLNNVNIPAGVTQFKNELFRNCSSIEEITFPSGLTAINTANTLSYCVNLKVMDFRNALAIPTLSATTILGNLNKLCKIIVPDALYETWKTTQYWTTYANQIVKASEA